MWHDWSHSKTSRVEREREYGPGVLLLLQLRMGA